MTSIDPTIRWPVARTWSRANRMEPAPSHTVLAQVRHHARCGVDVLAVTRG